MFFTFSKIRQFSSSFSFSLTLSFLFLIGCRQAPQEAPQTQLLFEGREYPYALFHDNTYYYTMQSLDDDVVLYATDDLRSLPTTTPKVIWRPDSLRLHHFWAPEIHRLNGRWYVYFEADDGNTDNHQLYVIENTSADPMKGEWTMKGVLHTNDEWNFGLHPNVLEVGGELYLFWSGWPKRRVEHETQCIYIAHLSNPWTVDSERVMISQPEYEWERQWINPDGSRSAYPIYVNENPEASLSPDGSRVCVCYSASGVWTQYHILGMLTAPSNADLLDPGVWTKSPEPIIVDSLRAGASNICIVPTGKPDSTLLLYEALWSPDAQTIERRSIFLKPVTWNRQGLPVFQ